jgi:F-type H+-transporting ATPase subunit delta
MAAVPICRAHNFRVPGLHRKTLYASDPRLLGGWAAFAGVSALSFSYGPHFVVLFRRARPRHLGAAFPAFWIWGSALAAQEMHVSGMAGRYAQALFDLCEETGTTESVRAGLAAFTEMARTSPDLQRFIKSPVFSAEDQVRALGSILAKAEITGVAANFLKLIASKRRLFAVFDMIRDFNLLNDARKRIARATVTVAEPLRPAHVEALRSALAEVSGGRDVDIAVKVDPAIIGGLIVQLGSRMVDSSLRTKLNSIRARMREAG